MNAQVSNEVSPNNSQEERTRLQGEALAKWYSQNIPGRTPEEWEEEWKRSREELARTIGPYLWGIIFVLTIVSFFYPLLGPVMAGIFGLWIVLGDGVFWYRVGVTASLTLVLGFGFPQIMAMVLGVLSLTAAGGYLAALVAARTRQMPTRMLQFSLWDFGGIVFAFAAEAALLRGAGFEFERFDDPWYAGLFIATAIFYAANVLLAASPFLVPQRYRGYLWWIFAGVMTLIAMPILEVNFCDALDIHLLMSDERTHLFSLNNPNAHAIVEHFTFFLASDSTSLETDGIVYQIHLLGVPIVWALLLMMEGVGQLDEVDVAKRTSLPEGPLE